MSATDDRAYAEVGRQMARWLALNDPHATPLADFAGLRSGTPADAARIEQALGDHLTAFSNGFSAGMAFVRDNPGLFGARDR